MKRAHWILASFSVSISAQSSCDQGREDSGDGEDDLVIKEGYTKQKKANVNSKAAGSSPFASLALQPSNKRDTTLRTIRKQDNAGIN